MSHRYILKQDLLFHVNVQLSNFASLGTTHTYAQLFTDEV